MSAFKVGDRVQIKENGRFSFNRVEAAFVNAHREGVIVEIDDTHNYGYPGYEHWTIRVATPDRSEWDKFSADELELVKESK